MSDHIFISYASEDRERIQPIIQVLEHRGWSVWWDWKVPPGRTFDDVIEEAIDAASCVIVVWSEKSVSSRCVKTEASEGVDRGILIPILIDDVKIPLEFRRIEGAILADWDGAIDTLCVIHAGTGGEFSFNANDIWSHASSLTLMGGSAHCFSHPQGHRYLDAVLAVYTGKNS